MTRARAGMAYMLAMAAVALLSLIVLALYTQLVGGVRQIARITDDTAQLYIAEGLFAKAANEIKKKPWSHWQEALARPRIERPAYRGAECTVVLDLVRDPQKNVVPRMVDVFVKVDYEGYRMTYVQRVKLNLISDLRPTELDVRRHARLDHDIEDDRERSRAVSWLTDQERAREWNRPASHVNVRYLAALTDSGASLGEAVEVLRAAQLLAPPPAPEPTLAEAALERLAREVRPRAAQAGIASDEALREGNRATSAVLDRMARDLPGAASAVVAALKTAGYASEVAKERELLDALRRGDEVLFTDPLPAARLPDAIVRFRAALAAARGQSAVNARESVPRALYRLAQALTVAAERLPFDEVSPGGPACVTVVTPRSGPPSRTQALTEVQDLYREITGTYRGSSEAAHAFIPWAWSHMKKVSMQNRAAWNAARGCALATLGLLRREYPLWHLWHEEAITAQPDSPGNRPPPTDEVVFHVESRIRPMIVFGLNAQPGGRAPEEVACGRVLFITDLDLRRPRHLLPAAVSAGRAQGSPSWMPDGTGLVFTLARGVDRAVGDLQLYEFAHPERTRVLIPDCGTAGDADVHPDGTRLLVDLDRNGNRDVYVLELDTLGLQRLTADAGADSQARWSPDGASIVFSSARTGRAGIYEMNADGSNVRCLVQPEPDKWFNVPCYSPDGTVIGFNQWRSDLPTPPAWPESNAWVMKRDGTNRRTVSPAGYHAGPWSRDGLARPLLKLDPSGAGGAVWMMDADGSDLRPLGGTDGSRFVELFGNSSWWCDLGRATRAD